MNPMEKPNLVGGGLGFVLGIIVCIESIKLKLWQFNMPGAGFMPFLTGVFIGLSGLILVFTCILKRLGEKEGLNSLEC